MIPMPTSLRTVNGVTLFQLLLLGVGGYGPLVILTKCSPHLEAFRPCELGDFHFKKIIKSKNQCRNARLCIKIPNRGSIAIIDALPVNRKPHFSKCTVLIFPEFLLLLCMTLIDQPYTSHFYQGSRWHFISV